jgi:hypothetical protein
MSQPVNWLSRYIIQDQDDANGFSLFVWDMKQWLDAIVTRRKVWRKKNEMRAVISEDTFLKAWVGR